MNQYHKAAIALFAAFLALAVLVNEKNTFVLQADFASFLAINHSHAQALNQLMIGFTLYGREVFWALVVILFAVFGGKQGRLVALVMTISFLVLIPLTVIAKQSIGRDRPVVPPEAFLLAADTHKAFPSGHATIVAAGAGIAVALFRKTQRQTAIAVGLTVESSLVCISRVYVGGHYPFDVIGGILFGLAVAFVFVGMAWPIELAARRLAFELKNAM